VYKYFVRLILYTLPVDFAATCGKTCHCITIRPFKDRDDWTVSCPFDITLKQRGIRFQDQDRQTAGLQDVTAMQTSFFEINPVRAYFSNEGREVRFGANGCFQMISCTFYRIPYTLR
jgi:hypothetical protein